MLMRRILFCIISVLFCLPFKAQDDPVVMTVNGYDINKSEFEYFLNKNKNETKVTRKTVKQYADLYLVFKLKVQAAIDEGMDESESFLNEYKMYRDMQAEEYLVDYDFLEKVARSTYDQSVAEVGEDGLAHLYVISSEPKDDTEDALMECYEKMLKVYELLGEGESFQNLASQYSEDQLAARGGEAGWVSTGQLPEDVAEIVFSLSDGEYSEPFVSDGTAFIVMVDSHRQLDPYEVVHDDIFSWLLNTDAYDEAKRRKADEYATRLGWTVRGDEAVAHLDSVLEEVEPEFGHISREYHDGLLLFDISNREIWERVTNHPEEMEAYFQSNIKKFKFDKPCFKGVVLFCREENDYKELKAILDNTDMSEWVDSILSFNKNGIKVRVMRAATDSGIFKEGQNVYVDKIVFGKGSYEPMQDYTYTNVVGRIIKQPESLQDAAGEVSEAYQTYLENEWVKKLKNKYPYTINKKVLKKVSLD